LRRGVSLLPLGGFEVKPDFRERPTAFAARVHACFTGPTGGSRVRRKIVRVCDADRDRHIVMSADAAALLRPLIIRVDGDAA